MRISWQQKKCLQRKYYIMVKISFCNRLKAIKNYNKKSSFKKLYRLVEIHYHLGLVEEAKKYASILGYNYNTSEWFEQSYKILNKDYKIKKRITSKEKKNNENSFIKKIINIIK